MPLNVLIGIFVFLCGLCLTASICIYISAQELHSRSIEILNIAVEWIEERKDKEANHE